MDFGLIAIALLSVTLLAYVVAVILDTVKKNR